MTGKAPGWRDGTPGKGRRFGVVVSRFHEPITARLLDGALAALRRHGAAEEDISVVWVPGAFEIPQVALHLARSGRFDALICLGVVIRGETPHFEHVAREAARGISEVALTTGVPTTFGVVTAESEAQALERAGGKVGNRGEEAALAALELAGLVRGLPSRGADPARPPRRSRRRR